MPIRQLAQGEGSTDEAFEETTMQSSPSLPKFKTRNGDRIGGQLQSVPTIVAAALAVVPDLDARVLRALLLRCVS